MTTDYTWVCDCRDPAHLEMVLSHLPKYPWLTLECMLVVATSGDQTMINELCSIAASKDHWPITIMDDKPLRALIDANDYPRAMHNELHARHGVRILAPLLVPGPLLCTADNVIIRSDPSFHLDGTVWASKAGADTELGSLFLEGARNILPVYDEDDLCAVMTDAAVYSMPYIDVGDYTQLIRTFYRHARTTSNIDAEFMTLWMYTFSGDVYEYPVYDAWPSDATFVRYQLPPWRKESS